MTDLFHQHSSLLSDVLKSEQGGIVVEEVEIGLRHNIGEFV